MKKYIFTLLAIWISASAWAETTTRTLTIECRTNLRFYPKLVNQITGKSINRKTYYLSDTIRIDTYLLEVGQPYNISLIDTIIYEHNAVYSYFSAWFRDGIFYSNSPEISLTMGSSDTKLTIVTVRSVCPPFSPGANYFDASTGTLIIDEMLDYYDLQRVIAAAEERYNFAKEDVLKLVAIGEVRQYSFDISAYAGSIYSTSFPNLQSLDLSQVSGGLNQLNTNHYSYTNTTLSYIALGVDLDTIQQSAFRWTKPDTIDCYALTPPRCHAAAFAYMGNSYDQVLVRVPAESVELYQQAVGWKNFTNIQPLSTVGIVSVLLPTDVQEGYYEDMSVEIKNLRSKSVLKRPVLNRRNIVFGSQVSGSEYQACLKNAYGQIMGQATPAVLTEDGLTLTIDKLLQKKDVSLKVSLADGTDVTDKVSVIWTDENETLMGNFSLLKAVAEGSHVNCKVSLRDELAKRYVTPDNVLYTVKGEGNNLLAIVLRPIEEMKLSGQVKDKLTGEGIAGATVALTQRQGENSKSITATTDANGDYSLQGTNEQGELSVTSPGYLPKTISISVPDAGSLPTVELEEFNGVIVSTRFTYTTTVREGAEAQVIEDYDAYSDVTYQVVNKTKKNIYKRLHQQGRKTVFHIRCVDGRRIDCNSLQH